MAQDQAALIKQVKEANDIVDVVGSYIPLRPAGPTFKGLCPFHDDHRPSFDVDPRRQRYRCWSCNKYGDVITFVQEHERVSFLEAVEVLARRAGISLEKKGASRHQSERALMLDTVRWAASQFQNCLLDAPEAEAARLYLGERRLTGETIRRFGVGFAPAVGTWLVRRAESARISLGLLEKVGLVAPREQGGYYDRFRERVMFPIRDPGGRTVGFGGRILPTSAYASRAPKYYNSADTPLFSKSEHLYGIDLARQAAAAAGYLAVVEGYTDVLMAHQVGLAQVVATMGTALNGRHVRQLRRFVPRVVLVFDADEGGTTGVDRALEIFASEEVDLKIAALPKGLDPCDLLVEQGPEAFRAVLESAVDALEFKLTQVLSGESAGSVEGKRRAVDAVLGVIALAPELPGRAGEMKRELMMTRIAQRLVLKEETLWARLDELRRTTRRRDPRSEDRHEPAAEKRAAPPAPEERQLLELLLADPQLVPMAAAEVAPEHLQHPGLRCLLDGMYRLQAEGITPELDQLRVRIDNPPLLNAALRLQEVGRTERDRPARIQQLLEVFRKRRVLPIIQELHNQLHAATDHAQAVELLRRLQEPNGGLGT